MSRKSRHEKDSDKCSTNIRNVFHKYFSFEYLQNTLYIHFFTIFSEIFINIVRCLDICCSIIEINQRSCREKNGDETIGTRVYKERNVVISK